MSVTTYDESCVRRELRRIVDAAGGVATFSSAHSLNPIEVQGVFDGPLTLTSTLVRLAGFEQATRRFIKRNKPTGE